MDFAFVPGMDDQAGRVRMLIARRSQTTLIGRARRRTTVRQFITHLNTASSISKPIGNILLGSHANSEGELYVTLFPGQRGNAKYDTLEESLNDPAKSIAIPDALTGYTTDPPTTFLHFKGCNVGKARPFLVKLKEALGDHILVTAPKHFHDIFFDTRYGVWESMAYEFVILRPLPFPDRATVLTEFGAASFQLIDGTPVPNANWDTPLASGSTWIPRRISASSKWPVPGKLVTPVDKRTTADLTYEFRVEPTSFRIEINSTATTEADRKDDLKDALAARARFKTSHPYPLYKELGYSSLGQFIGGYSWKFIPTKGGGLDCRGSRVIYTSVIPILDPADSLNGDLIANFYPKSGSAHPAILNVLVESDTKYFETV